MVFKIIWSSLALKTYISNIEYLEKDWTSKEVNNFINIVQRKISILSLQPKSGKITSKRIHLRQIVVHKRIILIYRFKPLKKEVELVRFFNTWQHPKKIKSLGIGVT
jgi:plasmid stabilization system protein ParE